MALTTIYNDRYVSYRKSPLVLDARDWGVVANGTTVCSDQIARAIAYCKAGGFALQLPDGDIVIDEPIVWDDPAPRLIGMGVRGESQTTGTCIKPDASSYNAIVLGDGAGGLPGGGFCYGIGVEGPTSRPTKNVKSAFLFNGVKGFHAGQLHAAKYDIGFRTINNCYASKFDMLAAPYSTCNVGLDLPKGSPTNNTGSDLVFHQSWLSGAIAGVHIGGSSGGYHFYGGQITLNAHGATSAGALGAVVFGSDYETGTASGGTMLDLNGIDFEGWREGYAIKGLAGFGNVLVTNCQFLATATGALRALGICHFTDLAGTRVEFNKNHMKGEYGNALLLTIAGAFDSQYSFDEHNWTNEAATVDNANSPVAIGLRAFRTLLIQRLIAGTSETPRGSGSYFAGGTNITSTQYRRGFGLISGTGAPDGVAGCEGQNGWEYRNLAGGDDTRRYILKIAASAWNDTGWVAITGE